MKNLQPHWLMLKDERKNGISRSEPAMYVGSTARWKIFKVWISEISTSLVYASYVSCRLSLHWSSRSKIAELKESFSIKVKIFPVENLIKKCSKPHTYSTSEATPAVEGRVGKT